MSAADVISALSSARKAIQLYPATHPAHGEALHALVDSVAQLTAVTPFVLNLHDGRLYHDSIVITDDVHGARAVAEAFEARTIESLSFNPDFNSQDASGLTEVLSLRPSPSLDVDAELAARGVSGVTVSVLEDEEDPDREEHDRQRQADRALYQRVLSVLQRLHDQFAGVGVGDMGETVTVVAGVIDRLLADPSAVLGLATIRGDSDKNLFHALNVMIYSLALGQRLGLPEEGLQSLGLSALLHDVGKSAFDAQDPSQTEAMRGMHPKVGAEILQRVGLEDPGPMLVAYEHHMSSDGGGWPEREAGYVAHPYSRMVAIANRYENLVSGTTAHESLTPDRAIVQVLREAGTMLDPFFARLLANALGVFPVGCLVRLSDHRVGVVARPGDDPLAPVVRIAYDERGSEIDDPAEVDLADGDVRIVEVIEPQALNVEVAEKL
ncbi:MAG: HD domain-containing protein [Coriobacteriia bacterium]|nr:HD domain-containing protein [Coriobacteriia bacterium]